MYAPAWLPERRALQGQEIRPEQLFGHATTRKDRRESEDRRGFFPTLREPNMDRKPNRTGVSYELWGPERFAQWLGEAILNGDLNASLPENLPVSIHADISADN